MSRTMYVLYQGRRYYDWTTVDASGRPALRWRDFGTRPEESDREPEVGDSITYQKYGKSYRKYISFVYFRGTVYEDTEGYDVEYREEEIV